MSFVLKVVLPRLLGLLGDFLLGMFKRVARNELDELLPIAEAVVRNLEELTVGGDEKRAEAFSEIKAAALGAEPGDSLINLAIELAVQKVKAEK